MSTPDDKLRPFYKGANRTFVVTFTSPDLVTTLNPEGRVDLTGATVYYTWKRFAGDSNPALLALLTGTGIVHRTQSGDTLGQADISVLYTDTDPLMADEYHRDVWVVLPGDDRKIVLPPETIRLDPAVLILP